VNADYSASVKKELWQVRISQAATRYGDNAPMAAVCCNACRTCTTTNLLALAFGVGAGAVYGAARFFKRLAL
jgi:hypothetical protein